MGSCETAFQSKSYGPQNPKVKDQGQPTKQVYSSEPGVQRIQSQNSNNSSNPHPSSAYAGPPPNNAYMNQQAGSYFQQFFMQSRAQPPPQGANYSNVGYQNNPYYLHPYPPQPQNHPANSVWITDSKSTNNIHQTRTTQQAVVKEGVLNNGVGKEKQEQNQDYNEMDYYPPPPIHQTFSVTSDDDESPKKKKKKSRP